MFRRNKLCVAVHPQTQGGQCRTPLQQPLNIVKQSIEFCAVDSLHQRLPRWKVPVQGPDAYLGLLCDLFQGDGNITPCEVHTRDLNELLAVTSGIGAQRRRF